jgi:ADP-dependent NAD(P)H-hydrate dehydratase / NAD(P)H-hydrate epimerase
MQLLATASDMQGWDRAAIDRIGVPGVVLMENAGREFTDQLELLSGPLGGRSLLVLAGKGNNGGDGYVIARHSLNRGALVTVALLARPDELRGDALTNFSILRRMMRTAGESLRIVFLKKPGNLASLGGTEIIVDAIFGTGFSGAPSGLYRRAIEWINSQRAFKASVDIASGVDASTGVVSGVAVQADITITMAVPKVGQFVGAGWQASGAVHVVDIGIPKSLVSPPARATYVAQAGDLSRVLPQRSRFAHKYSVGKVFVIAGSRAFTGAPVLCAQAGLVSGAGSVVLGIPESIHRVVASRLREVISVPLTETEAGTVSGHALEEIRRRIAWADVVVMGPGLGRHPETDGVLHLLMEETDKPLVIDADGLNALIGKTTIVKRRKSPTILTPHTGELSRMIGADSSSIEADRVGVARSAARTLRSVVILKGAPTATADPAGRVVLNTTGNPGMATIGAGDVLTGVVAGLLGQGVEPFDAAWLSAYLHGRAGDLAAERLGMRSVVASDILDHVASALREAEKTKERGPH